MHTHNTNFEADMHTDYPLYLGYKDKSQNGGGTNKEPSADESRVYIDKILQSM